MNSSSKVVVITGCSSGFGEGAVRSKPSQTRAAKQPIQDRVLKEMQLEGVLGGTDA